jgi:hypothetical protein
VSIGLLGREMEAVAVSQAVMAVARRDFSFCSRLWIPWFRKIFTHPVLFIKLQRYEYFEVKIVDKNYDSYHRVEAKKTNFSGPACK